MLKYILLQNQKTNEKFLLCSPANLSKLNIKALFRILKQFFSCFTVAYFMNHSVILWNSPSMHSVKRGNTAYSFEQTKEIMYWKWNTALLAEQICSIP